MQKDYSDVLEVVKIDLIEETVGSWLRAIIRRLEEEQTAIRRDQQKQPAPSHETLSLQAGIGAMIAVLGGIDALVFTAGIGENSPEVRAAACANFRFFGLKLDAPKNAQSSADQDISPSDSAVRVLIVRAQEDWAIARDCWHLVSPRSRLVTFPGATSRLRE